MPSTRVAVVLSAAVVAAVALPAGAAAPTRTLTNGHVAISAVVGGLPAGATISVLQFCPARSSLDARSTAGVDRAADASLDPHLRLASREFWPAGTVSRFRLVRPVPSETAVTVVTAALCSSTVPRTATTARGAAATDLRVWGPAPSRLAVANATVALVTDDPDADTAFATVMRAGGVASSRGSLRGAVTAVQEASTDSGLSTVTAVGETSRQVPRGSFISMENRYSYVSDLTREITAPADQLG